MQHTPRQSTETDSTVWIEEPPPRRCRRCGKRFELDEAALKSEREFCFWCSYVEPQG